MNYGLRGILGPNCQSGSRHVVPNGLGGVGAMFDTPVNRLPARFWSGGRGSVIVACAGGRCWLVRP